MMLLSDVGTKQELEKRIKTVGFHMGNDSRNDDEDKFHWRGCMKTIPCMIRGNKM